MSKSKCAQYLSIGRLFFISLMSFHHSFFICSRCSEVKARHFLSISAISSCRFSCISFSCMDFGVPAVSRSIVSALFRLSTSDMAAFSFMKAFTSLPYIPPNTSIRK